MMPEAASTKAAWRPTERLRSSAETIEYLYARKKTIEANRNRYVIVTRGGRDRYSKNIPLTTSKHPAISQALFDDASPCETTDHRTINLTRPIEAAIKAVIAPIVATSIPIV